MDSKTPPINPSNTSSGTGSGTSQQAQTMSLSIQFAVLNSMRGGHSANSQLNIPISPALSTQLANWLQQAPAPKIEQLPANLANWLVEHLNKHQTQQGQPRLTLSQWLPIISQLTLAQTARADANQSMSTATYDVLRVVFALGSQSPASNANKLSNKTDGIAQLLKLLVPIPLQDKASLVIRERQPSAADTDSARLPNNELAAMSRDTQNPEHNKVTGKDEETSQSKSTKGELQPLSFTLNFDLDALGLLCVEFDLIGLSLSSRCYCSNLKLQSSVEQTWPQLEERLRKFGFSVKNDIQLEPNLSIEQPNLAKNKPNSGKQSGLIDIKV
ncbi:hypothetical protein J1N51_03785 [Psychrosphaera ytuae]|uniref:Uncharacterized protein n=1 Tax=Psychrosphaera ytuae TaxID=2820710 RepID=A0A975DFC0_9GAMM|nr:hypothetical protein [Psychrosphaera ytuae]QTH64600.1 hypothetical protein J1N51_03785 [Psychrosphaera ytuae]